MITPPPTSFFPFNATAPSDIYTLSLHDALPICTSENTKGADATSSAKALAAQAPDTSAPLNRLDLAVWLVSPEHPLTADRKSTRLNSSHITISYAVFCLKKKNKKIT